MTRKCDICYRPSVWEVDGDGIIYAYCNGHSPVRPVTWHRRKPKVKTLSPGQMEVIALLGTGVKRKDIATMRGVSITTVKYQIICALYKLGFKNKTQLARYAWENGLVDNEDTS